MEIDDKNQSALLKMDGKSFKLSHAPTGSGVKYSDGKTTVWMKGNEAFAEVDGKIIMKDC